MKSIVKCSVLLISIFSLLGCSQEQSISSSGVSSSETTSSSDSSNNSSTTSMEPGVSAEEYSAKANAINKVAYKTAKITYSFREKTTGVYPTKKADGTAMEANTEVTSSLVIEDKRGDGDFRVVSGEASSEMNNLKLGANLYITGWYTWMQQLKKNAESPQSNVTFEARYYLNPLGAWYKNTGTRPGLANATYEGEYLGSEEYFMHYGENGYCTSFTLNRFISNVGVITRFSSDKTEYNGTYTGVAEATVEYTF